MKIFLKLAAIALPLATAQDITTVRTIQNARLCASAALPKDCTDAQFQASKQPGKTLGAIYSTDAALQAAILSEQVAALTDENTQRAMAVAMKAFSAASGNDRVAACTALKVADPETCR